MLFQPERHLALADRFDDAMLYRLLAEQLQGPTLPALGWIGASQGDDLLPLPLSKSLRSAGARRIKNRLFNPACAELPTEGADRPVGTADMLSDFVIRAAFGRFQQHLATPNHLRRSRP